MTLKKPKIKPADQLEGILISEGFENYIREFKFHPVRKWRFDFAFTEDKVAVEIQGGTWIGGRHVSGMGYEKDSEKLNEAQIFGWDVLYITTSMIKDGRAIDYIRRILNDTKTR